MKKRTKTYKKRILCKFTLSMEQIHHHILQFFNGARNYENWFGVGCSEKRATKDICGKDRECNTSVYHSPMTFNRTAAMELELLYNSAHGST